MTAASGITRQSFSYSDATVPEHLLRSNDDTTFEDLQDAYSNVISKVNKMLMDFSKKVSEWSFIVGEMTQCEQALENVVMERRHERMAKKKKRVRWKRSRGSILSPEGDSKTSETIQRERELEALDTQYM